jgi:hypothetical protein
MPVEVVLDATLTRVTLVPGKGALGTSPVCSQNRIRSKSAWGHSDLPQKPRFSWSERYLGNQS